MKYFWEIFWLVVFVAAGAFLFPMLLGWLWWVGALIGLGVYLVLLLVVKTGGSEGIVNIIDI